MAGGEQGFRSSRKNAARSPEVTLGSLCGRGGAMGFAGLQELG